MRRKEKLSSIATWSVNTRPLAAETIFLTLAASPSGLVVAEIGPARPPAKSSPAGARKASATSATVNARHIIGAIIPTQPAPLNTTGRPCTNAGRINAAIFRHAAMTGRTTIGRGILRIMTVDAVVAAAAAVDVAADVVAVAVRKAALIRTTAAVALTVN